MTRLKLSTLGRLQGGAFGPAVDAELEKALADCDSRPGLDKARRVTITLEIRPAGSATEGNGALNTLEIRAAARAVLPPQVTRHEYLDFAVAAKPGGGDEPRAIFAQGTLYNQPGDEN